MSTPDSSLPDPEDDPRNLVATESGDSAEHVYPPTIEGRLARQEAVFDFYVRTSRARADRVAQVDARVAHVEEALQSIADTLDEAVHSRDEMLAELAVLARHAVGMLHHGISRQHEMFGLLEDALCGHLDPQGGSPLLRLASGVDRLEDAVARQARAVADMRAEAELLLLSVEMFGPRRRPDRP